MGTNFKTPINRNNMFYSEEDFTFENEIMEGYLEEDTNQTVVVYEVDRNKTNMNTTYQETPYRNNIRFKPPKEVPCLYEISDSTLQSYETANQNATYSISGNLVCYIMLHTFEKYNFDIKRGDYLGIMIEEGRMQYFVVSDDGKVNTSNKLVVGAYKTGWRVIKAVAEQEIKPLA